MFDDKLDVSTAHQMPAEIVRGHQIELDFITSSSLNMARLTDHSGARRSFHLPVLGVSLYLSDVANRLGTVMRLQSTGDAPVF